MAVKTREEILASIRTRIGEDTSDDAIALVEDVQDTFTDLEAKVSSDGKDWKAEAERIDKEWRQKYTDRFFNTGAKDEPDNGGKDEPEEKSTYTFDKLFKEEK